LEPPNETLPADDEVVAVPAPKVAAPLAELAVEPDAETEPEAAKAEPAPRAAVAAAIAISEVRIALLSLHHMCAENEGARPNPHRGRFESNFLRVNNVVGTTLDRLNVLEPISVG